MDCTVEVRDQDGVRHSVQVNAKSLYEAAVEGIVALRKSLFPVAIHPPTQLVIRVQPPTTLHVLEMSKVQTWLNSAKSPKDAAIKNRFKAMLTEPDKDA